MSLEQIKSLATKCERSAVATGMKLYTSNEKEAIEKAQSLLNKISLAGSVDEVKNYLTTNGKDIVTDCENFYIKSPRWPEAEALFNIARKLVPEGAPYPNGQAYQLLMSQLRNPFNCVTTDDQPAAPADLIITSTGEHLLSIAIISQGNYVYNYEDSTKRCFNDCELNQIWLKNRSVYNQLQDILRSNKGSLSPETLDKLKTLVEVALSYNSSSPEEIHHLKAHFLHAMESDKDFADYMQKYDLKDVVPDTHDLLSRVYLYFQEYRIKLPDQERIAFDQLVGENSELLIDRFQNVWDRNPVGGCASMTASFLANFVCLVADPNTPFANAQYPVHIVPKVGILGYQHYLVRGDKGSFILEILAGSRYCKDYRWYHLISPYHKGEKQTPWFRLLFMTILSLGILPVFYLLKNSAKLVIGSLLKYPETKLEAIAFYFAKEAAKSDWAGFKLAQGFFKIVSLGFSLLKNTASLFVSPVQTIKKAQRYFARVGYWWRGTLENSSYLHEDPSVSDRLWAGAVRGVLFFAKLLEISFSKLDKISFVLTSPIAAYQKISQDQGKSAGYLMVLGVCLTYLAALVFAAPAIEALTTLMFGAYARGILDFFTQLPALPVISDMLSPMGSGLTNIIQPIIATLGLSTTMIYATSTLIIVPLLLMQLGEGVSKMWEQYCTKKNNPDQPSLPPTISTAQPITPSNPAGSISYFPPAFGPRISATPDSKSIWAGKLSDYTQSTKQSTYRDLNFGTGLVTKGEEEEIQAPFGQTLADFKNSGAYNWSRGDSDEERLGPGDNDLTWR
jgi:hypothetical protein